MNKGCREVRLVMLHQALTDGRLILPLLFFMHHMQRISPWPRPRSRSLGQDHHVLKCDTSLVANLAGRNNKHTCPLHRLSHLGGIFIGITLPAGTLITNTLWQPYLRRIIGVVRDCQRITQHEGWATPKEAWKESFSKLYH